MGSRRVYLSPLTADTFYANNPAMQFRFEESSGKVTGFSIVSNAMQAKKVK
jgi:hypothetical protein